MNIQPLDLPSLIRAVGWPAIAVIALIVFRQPLAELVPFLSQRINKLSFGIFSLDLAEMAELRPPALEMRSASSARRHRYRAEVTVFPAFSASSSRVKTAATS